MAGEPQQPVPVGDLEIAQRIAGSARSGGRSEREPTLEQLLGAFGEPEPTAQARTRVASALTLAGLRATPSVHEAHPGERVKLRPPASGGRGRLGAGLAALVAVIAAAAVLAAVTSGGGNGNDSASSALAPATTAATTATVPPTTATVPATTATTPVPAKPKKKPAPKKKRKRKPAAPKQVVVRLVPGPQASYLCVDHGPGTPTIETTLDSPQTFKGKRVRLNVGLNSVSVTINGKPFALASSPSGYDISLKGRAYLPQGQRPCA